MNSKKRPKVALVLSGGAARGIAHIGVLEILHEADIPIDMIVGCSIGSIIGVLYAQEPDPKKIHELIFSIWPTNYSYKLLGAPSIRQGIRGYGFFSTQHLRKLFAKHLKVERLEELSIPMHIVSTDLEKGSLHTFSTGSILDAVCSSIAIPGFFEPVQIGDRYYVDGGIISVLPTEIAKQLGADIIIGSDVSIKLGREKNLDSLWFKTWAIIEKKKKEQQESIADILLLSGKEHTPALWKKKSVLHYFYEDGKRVAKEHLQAIRELIT